MPLDRISHLSLLKFPLDVVSCLILSWLTKKALLKFEVVSNSVIYCGLRKHAELKTEILLILKNSSSFYPIISPLAGT